MQDKSSSFSESSGIWTLRDLAFITPVRKPWVLEWIKIGFVDWITQSLSASHTITSFSIFFFFLKAYSNFLLCEILPVDSCALRSYFQQFLDKITFILFRIFIFFVARIPAFRAFRASFRSIFFITTHAQTRAVKRHISMRGTFKARKPL